MVKVILNRQFKNHPPGTELDVSTRVLNVLIDRGCVSRPTPEPEQAPVKEKPRKREAPKKK